MRASTNGRPREIGSGGSPGRSSDDRIVSVAISEDEGGLVLARRGGSKLSGDFSSVGHYRVTDVGIDDLGWSEDLPRPVLSLSPDGSRVAFHSSTAGSGGSLSLGLVGPALRHPPLPPHGETLGDRQAAEASVPKGKVTSAACSNEATYVFEAKRGLCFPAHDAAQVTELDLKGVETCRVLPSGDLVTVDKSGKIRRSGPRGAKVWEPKARGSKLVLAVSPDGRFVYSGWLFSADTGAAVGQVEGITGLSLAAVFLEDMLFVSDGSEAVGYSVASVAVD